MPINNANRFTWLDTEQHDPSSAQHRHTLICNPDGAAAVLDQFGDRLTGSGTILGVVTGAQAGPAIEADTGAVINTPAGWAGLLNYRRNRGWILNTRIRTTDITSLRFFFAVTSVSLATMVGADLPVANYAGFRFSTNVPDTNFRCLTSDGATTTNTDSAIAASSNTRAFGIKYNHRSPATVIFLIDENEVARNTATLPGSTTDLRIVLGIQNLAAASRFVRFESIQLITGNGN